MADYRYPNAAIAIFAKAPVPGKVKTRMQPELTAEQSAQLQGNLIDHTLTTALASQLAPVQLWCSPSQSHPAIQSLALPASITLHDQCGENLGQRMAHAFGSNLPARDFVLLIGTDCPLLTPQHLHEAAEQLEAADVVITGAEDGGYVLIGARQHPPDCFENVEWGSARVLQQTVARLERERAEFQILPSLPDLDRPADLRNLDAALRQLLTGEGEAL